ncbi:hypothetical protein OEA41_006528 [Lepraria neglecta]|uniref:Amidoligase enzyme n=1 Tax=Lepraria neglecta TaxID=209136 RepID=A0AAE0DKK3_9LECA|nr:hypothetical protein OEA41_006528 [Lepraria neglecta]
MDDSLKLTFSIELECIVRYDPATYEDYLGELNEIRATVDAKLQMLLCKHIVYGLGGHGFSACDGMRDPSSQKWVVDKDDSIYPPPTDNGYCYVDVELKSPAYNFAPAALGQVEQVIRLLTNAFDVDIDKSCGLHVHVGNQRKGFPLQTLKNFCMLTTIFERQFNSLHPSGRVRRNSFVKAMTKAYEGVSPLDTALLIQSFTTHKQLVQRFTGDSVSLPDRYYACNFCPPVFKPTLGTIEFRQHKSTMDTDVICMWVKLACGLVRTAHDMRFGDLAQLIADVASGSNIDAINLLSELQLGSSAKSYGRQRRYSHPQPPWAWVDPMEEETVELGIKEKDNEFVNGEKVVKTIAKHVYQESMTCTGDGSSDDDDGNLNE